MANINYINPESFRPQLPQIPMGFRSGMMRREQEDDYNSLLANQMALQNIGARSAGLDLQEKVRDVPLKDLEREGKMATLQAKQPFLADLATSDARAKIAGNEYSTVEKGPEGLKALRDKWARELSAERAIQQEREHKLSMQLLEQAMAMPPEQGQQFMTENIDKYSKLGYEMPSWLASPQTWKPMYQGMVDNIAHRRAIALRQMQEEGDTARNNATNAARIRAAEIAAAATRERASISAKGRGGANQYRLEAQIDKFANMEPDDPDYEQQKAIVQALLRERAEATLSKDDTFMLEYQRAKTPAEKQAVRERHVSRRSRDIISEFEGSKRAPNSTPPSNNAPTNRNPYVDRYGLEPPK